MTYLRRTAVVALACWGVFGCDAQPPDGEDPCLEKTEDNCDPKACSYYEGVGCIRSDCDEGECPCEDLAPNECNTRSWCTKIIGEIVEPGDGALCLTGETLSVGCTSKLPGCDSDVGVFMCDGENKVFLDWSDCRPEGGWNECGDAGVEPPAQCR